MQFVGNAVWHWWKLAAPIGLILAAVTAGLVYWAFVPVYRAEAWLRIDAEAPYIAFEGGREGGRPIATEVSLIRSPLTMGPVVSQPEIARLPEIKEADAAIEWLTNQINVRQVGHSELFVISCDAEVPKNAATIVNAVVDAYFELRGQDEAERVQRVIELLEEERERRSADLARLRENVREMTKMATGKDPFKTESAATLEMLEYPLHSVQSKLVRAEVQQEILKAQIKAYEEMTSNEPVEVPDAVVDRAVEEAEDVQNLKAAIFAKRAKLEQIEAVSAKGDKDPFYKQLAAEIERNEETLQEVRAKLRPMIKAEMTSTLINSQQAGLANMRSSLQGWEITSGALQARYEEELKKAQQGTGETLALEFKRAELQREQAVFDLITGRVVALRTEQRAPARVTLLREAETPRKPVELVPVKKMAFVALAVFCLPFGLAVLWERVVRRVTDPDNLEQHANLSVVGEIARLPTRASVSKGTALARGGRNLRMFEESIDSLRTRLVLSESLRDMKVVVVTSAANNEGKTSVAVQLAVSIARSTGEPTLLIDGDMRSPDIHGVLQTELSPGLAEVLAGENTLQEAIVTDWSDYVHILPAGNAQVSPHKLLGNGTLEALFDETRQSYRYIIVDTPPVLAASEALVLARAADATLICAMRDISRIDQVKKTHERLVNAGAQPVGVVLNGISTSRYAYRYGNYAFARS